MTSNAEASDARLTQMTEKMPRALGKSPLLEAIFELRFHATVPNAGDLLPGLLFARLRGEYPDVQQLPAGTIPRNIREKDPNLTYQPTHRLAGQSRAVQVGDRVVSLTVSSPYPGWDNFKGAILQLLSTLGGTEVIREPERFSFRYINLIPMDSDRRQLALLNVRTQWPNQEFLERGFQLRFEREQREFISIIQVTPQVTAKKVDGVISGLLIDVDTICAKPPRAFWEGEANPLEDAHSLAKQTFYSLLTDSTLASLEPVYDTTPR